MEVIQSCRSSGMANEHSFFVDSGEDSIFCISSIIFKTIIENYNKIMEFSDWDRIIN